MKKTVLLFLSLTWVSATGFASTILFPEIDLFSVISTNLTLSTSYRLDVSIDTGVKYGLTMGLGFKGYNITTFSSNLATLSSIRIYSRPLNLFQVGYFFGKNRTLGLSDFSYRGFEHHPRPNFEYVGYKDITGMGVEVYDTLWDNLFEPHLIIYSQNPVISTNITNTNSLNVDSLFYLNTDNYSLELYAGINMKPTSQTNIFEFSFYRHAGLTFKTTSGKLDFMMSIFLPDSYTNTGMNGLFEFPNPDDIYVNVTEHIIAGLFEQTLTIFSRPSMYNEFQENWRGDLDIYLALGLKFEKIGFGIENTLAMLEGFNNLDNKIGAYAYFNMNSLKYKFAGYYTVHALGNQIYPLWAGFLSITGNL